MSPDRGRRDLRRDLDGILAGALAAVDPEERVRRALARSSLTREGARGRADVLLVAVGKAAGGMARGAFEALEPRVRETVIVTPRVRGTPRDGIPESRRGGEEPPSAVRVFHGSHPFPDEGSVAGARAVLRLARQAGPDDRIVFLLSGGASALLTLPPDGVSLTDIATTARRLMESGADIVELNTVRKHLDRLKGGGLARVVAPTPLWAGILSDVVGDRLDVIGSGPVSPDPTTFGDALHVVRTRVRRDVPPAVLRYLERGARGELPETPSEEDPCFRNVETRIVGNAETALAGAADAARERGYEVRTGSPTVTGEARSVGRELGRLARRLAGNVGEGGEIGRVATRETCFLSAGETTVTVTGDGRGGPNQEVALAAALELGSSGLEVLVASLGTDGVDGPTDAAGAVADATTVSRARRMGLLPEVALDDNDAYPFFRALGDHIVTGPTGTNVMDLHIVLVRPTVSPGPTAGPPT